MTRPADDKIGADGIYITLKISFRRDGTEDRFQNRLSTYIFDAKSCLVQVGSGLCKGHPTLLMQVFFFFLLYP